MRDSIIMNHRRAALPFTALLLLLVTAGAGAEIVRGTDAFQFVYRVTLPEMAEPGRLWLPLAKTGIWQKVTIERISAPGESITTQDSYHQNDILVLPITAAHSGKVIEVVYRVSRTEKATYVSDGGSAARYLAPERLVPANETFKALAAQVTRGETGGLARGRALYEHVAKRMRYDKSGVGWGRGDAVYACDARAGNCTDFHAYFIALARAADIPARFAIGVTIPADKQEGSIAGYHCWAEFLADGMWVPVDISEAAKHPELAEYYFGHHPANRFELSVGRDLAVEPAPASGAINFLVYPLLEIGGKVVKTEPEFSFSRAQK
jgi:transglutaminase-like putative cysteine protease